MQHVFYYTLQTVKIKKKLYIKKGNRIKKIKKAFKMKNINKLVFKKNVYPFLIIIILGFFIYSPTLFFDFSFLDDNNLILDHYYFLKDFKNIFHAFKFDAFYNFLNQSYYRPALTISFILDAQITKQAAWGYHLTNVLIHAINSCLVFLLLKNLNIKKRLSFFLALIFTVHPVLTQAVAWIPGRNDSLLALFSLLSFLSLIKLSKLNKHSFKKLSKLNKHSFKKLSKLNKTNNYLKEAGFLTLSLLFFLLALFTKETALLLPILFGFFIFLLKPKKLSSEQTQVLIIGWILIIVFFFVLKKLVFQHPMAWDLQQIIKGLFFSLPALLLYIGKPILPINLTVMPILKDSSLYYGILVFLALLLALILSKKKSIKMILFGFIWFFIFLIPSLIRPNPEKIAYFFEHRIYFSFIGFLILMSQISFIKKFKPFKEKSLFLSLGLIVGLSVITLAHSQSFKNRLIFWQKAVKGSPQHAFAHNNLGAMYYLDGNLDKAEEEFILALKLNPQEKLTHNNLGLIYMKKGRFSEAKEEFEKEISINPYYDNVYFNLGLLYQKQNNLKKAIEVWEKTLSLNPSYLTAHQNLAVVYLQIENKEKAFYHTNQIILKGGQLPEALKKALDLNY
jgi:protein O-mannosyl-transferase